MNPLQNLHTKYNKYLDEKSPEYDKKLHLEFNQLVWEGIAVAKTHRKKGNTEAYYQEFKTFQKNFKQFEQKCKNHQKAMNKEAKIIVKKMKEENHPKYQENPQHFKTLIKKNVNAKQLDELKKAAGIQPAPSGGPLNDFNRFKSQNRPPRSGYDLDPKSVKKIFDNPQGINLGYLNNSLNALAESMKKDVNEHLHPGHGKPGVKNK